MLHWQALQSDLLAGQSLSPEQALALAAFPEALDPDQRISDDLAELVRPWFAGGTIAIASVAAAGHRLVPGHAGFEDGTLDFLSLPAVRAGIEVMERIDINSVHDRVQVLTAGTLERMQDLRHANGSPLVQVLGPWEPVDRGATVAFVLVDPDGHELADRSVERMATTAGIFTLASMSTIMTR